MNHHVNLQTFETY